MERQIAKRKLVSRLMFRAIPIPRAQKTVDRNHIPIVADDCMHIAKDIVIAGSQLVICYPAEVAVNLILELPAFGFIVSFRLLPRLDSVGVGQDGRQWQGLDIWHWHSQESYRQ